MDNIIKKAESVYDYQLLIKHLLNTPLTMFPEREIVYRDIRRYTYRDFYKRIHKLANGLKKLGVLPGSTVGVMDWDSHRYLELYFAVPMMGAVLHTVNVRLTPKQILYTINHAEDDMLIINKDFLPILNAIQGNIETVKRKILITDDNKTDIKSTFDAEYETLVDESEEYYDFPDLDENTRATTFYTSGTTGNPKGVYFSHRQLVLHTIGLISGVTVYDTNGKVGSNDVYMPLTPMFHVHAWGIPYFSTALGLKQVYPGKYEPDMILSLIKKENVTFSHCVPTILQMILTYPEAKNVDLSKWKIVIGGAALTKNLCKMGIERGIDVYAGYGLSETCPVLTLAHLKPYMHEYTKDQQIAMRCKTGLPIMLVDVEIMNLDGKMLPHNGKSVGEVVVRAPWLTMGYFKEKEKSEELWRDGWMHTGDVGYIDQEGYLQITDRIKDVVKSGGEWISTLQLEDILTGHESVNEAMVIGIPDEKWGERPFAVVVLKDRYRNKITQKDLKDFFMKFVEDGTISKWAIPDKIEIADSLPKTSTGKLDKKAIKDKLKHRIET